MSSFWPTVSYVRTPPPAAPGLPLLPSAALSLSPNTSVSHALVVKLRLADFASFSIFAIHVVNGTSDDLLADGSIIYSNGRTMFVLGRGS